MCYNAALRYSRRTDSVLQAVLVQLSKLHALRKRRTGVQEPDQEADLEA